MEDSESEAELYDNHAMAALAESSHNDSLLEEEDSRDDAEEVQDLGTTSSSEEASADEKMAPATESADEEEMAPSGDSARNESEMALGITDELDLEPGVSGVEPVPEILGNTAAAFPALPRRSEEEVRRLHPGVFVMETEVVTGNSHLLEEEDISTQVDNKKFLESLPCTERLRASSRDGSVSGDGKSETGENLSDRESVVSGVVTRNLRRKDVKKTQTKVTKSRAKKGPGLTTRAGKGRGRRTLLKRKPVKSIRNPPTPVTADKVYYRGEFYSLGDIVSVTDIDGDIFYAQLRGFLTDEYGEKSGVISWLLPTTGSPPPNQGFHPATYIIGPEEEIPRSLSVFTFVMHAPSDYFYFRNAPYRTATRPPTSATSFTSLRLGPRLRIVKEKPVFVGL